MLEFRTDVRLNADASPEEAIRRLMAIMSAPYSFSTEARRKPLRGHINATSGLLRWPLMDYRIASLRRLRFEIRQDPGGSVLIGAFRTFLALRVVILIWLGCGSLFWMWQLVQGLFHHASLAVVGRDLLPILIGLGMAYGYVGLFVFLGRRRDQSLIRVLRTTLGSESGAAIVKELLSVETGAVSFVDAPRDNKLA